MLGYGIALGVGIVQLGRHGTSAIVGYNAALVAVLFMFLFWKGEAASQKWEPNTDAPKSGVE